MKSKNVLFGISLAVALQLGALACSAQTNKYLYTGSATNITLAAGTYIITAYGAQGGNGTENGSGQNDGGLGAEMAAQFYFPTSTTLTLLVGGDGGANICGGGGGGSFVVNGSTPLVVAGGGGGGGSFAGSGSGSFGFPGVTSTNGSAGDSPYSGAGGTGGGGYASTYGTSGGGGGGFYSNGGAGNEGAGGGVSFVGGGAGGTAGSIDGGGGGGLFYGAGGGGGYSGGGGEQGGAGGGGGGSIIDSSAITNLAEVSGIASPDDLSGNGEIIITAVSATPVPPLLSIALIGVPGLATNTVNEVIVSWPTTTNEFVLLQNSNPAKTNWTPNTNAITTTNGSNSVTIPLPVGNLFFRLEQQIFLIPIKG